MKWSFFFLIQFMFYDTIYLQTPPWIMIVINTLIVNLGQG